MVWILVFLGFIFFFCWGIVSFFRMLFGHTPTVIHTPDTDAEKTALQSQVNALNKVLHELEMLARENPHKPAGEILAEIQGNIATISTPLSRPKPSTPPTPPTNSQLSAQNWYDDNSINLLLYVGAFLIIAAASIFVGFSWEVLDGTLKALLFTAVTVGFFTAGLHLYKAPKTKSAGATFTAIGALLIPFTGLTWHNFAFNGYPATAGITWALTSIISISIYFYLALKFSSKYYSYAASIASISLALSTVKIFGLNNDFYIFMGIISSYAMLAVSMLYKSKNERDRHLITQPLELTSYITLPVSLILGLLVALVDDKLYSLEAVISVALAIGFYAIIYRLKAKPEYFAAITFLGTFLIFITTKFLLLPLDLILTILSVTAISQVASAYYYQTKHQTNETNILLLIAQTVMILVFCAAWSSDLIGLQLLFGTLNCGVALSIAYLKRNAYFGLLATGFTLVLPLIYLTQYLKIIEPRDTLLSVYLIFGTIGFAAIYLKYESLHKYNLLQTILTSTLIWYVLAFVLSTRNNDTLFSTSLILALVGYASAIKFNKAELYYAAQTTTIFTLVTFLTKINTPSENYPLYLTALALLFYGIGQAKSGIIRQTHENVAKILGLATPLFFGLRSLDTYSATKSTELNALVSLDIIAVLYAYDAYIKKSANNAYIASAVAVLALLWHLKTMGIENGIVYATILGVYFMALGYFKKYQANSSAEIFDYTGMAFLIIPPFLSSTGFYGIIYSLVLLLSGAALLAYGISTSIKRIRYGGITAIALAILAQTSGIIFNLPWWLILALLGGGFLYTAVHLLNKRK